MAITKVYYFLSLPLKFVHYVVSLDFFFFLALA